VPAPGFGIHDHARAPFSQRLDMPVVAGWNIAQAPAPDVDGTQSFGSPILPMANVPASRAQKFPQSCRAGKYVEEDTPDPHAWLCRFLREAGSAMLKPADSTCAAHIALSADHPVSTGGRRGSAAVAFCRFAPIPHDRLVRRFQPRSFQPRGAALKRMEKQPALIAKTEKRRKQ
jgi:hypothetical protein